MRREKPVRLAVAGGRRGKAFNQALQVFSDRVRLTAVCDLQAEVLEHWRDDFPNIQTFTSFDDLLTRGDFDAVYLATPLGMHPSQAIAAMHAGKHVLSEVTAATTLEECWQLVETVEQSGCTFMMAENYCYMRPNMMVLEMVQRGVFGELTYAEGAYIHDCRNLLFDDNAGLTWRGKMHRDRRSNNYPTHSLGPVAQWLGINRRDRLVRTATMVSQSPSAPRYAAEKFGIDHPAAREGFFANGDSAGTLIQTERGAVIYLRVDFTSARPHNMTHYVLQGSHAAYLSARHHAEDPLIWIDGRSPGVSPGNAEWESLWNYSDEYEHPRWRDWGDQARRAGHGGGDFFVLNDFIQAILDGTPPPIDVYDAVTWSSITPLAIESIKQGGSAVDVPDFRRKRGQG